MRKINGEKLKDNPSSLLCGYTIAAQQEIEEDIDFYSMFTPASNTSSKPAVPDSIYKNVLNFPADGQYVKYFDTHPHLDRIPEELRSFNDIYTNVDLNIPLMQKQIEFEKAMQSIDHLLSDLDRKLTRMPSVMLRKMDAAADEDYKIAYKHLMNSFLTYFSTPSKGEIKPDIQWIDYKFAINYPTAQKALTELRANLFNDAAKAKLIEKLVKAGAFNDKQQDFYFWNTEPENWSEISFQSRSVKHVFPVEITKFNFCASIPCIGRLYNQCHSRRIC